LNSCVLFGNYATNSGGGAYGGILRNCTLTKNSAAVSGGAFRAELDNCVVYYNVAPSNPNFDAASSLTNTCSTPLAAGPGNITNAPAFEDLASNNFRLGSNSPCINAGNNALVAGGADADGRQRVFGAAVDMGAYEYQSSEMNEFIAWLQSYDLPTDSSSDNADSDGDQATNFQEWLAGTVPTNAASVFSVVGLTREASGFVVRWASVTNRTYFLQRASGDSFPWLFQTLAMNIVGQSETTTYTNNGAAPDASVFFRVGTLR
jgi:hypothetical protein